MIKASFNVFLNFTRLSSPELTVEGQSSPCSLCGDQHFHRPSHVDRVLSWSAPLMWAMVRPDQHRPWRQRNKAKLRKCMRTEFTSTRCKWHKFFFTDVVFIEYIYIYIYISIYNLRRGDTKGRYTRQAGSERHTYPTSDRFTSYRTLKKEMYGNVRI